MKNILLLAMTAVCLSFSAQGANVGATGYSTDFSVVPPAADWTTLSVAGTAGTPASTAAFDLLIVTNSVTIITAALNTSNANPPNAVAPAVWCSAGYVQTRVTGNAYAVLLAKLQNTSTTNANNLVWT